MLTHLRILVTGFALVLGTIGQLRAALIFTEQAGGSATVPFGTIDSAGNKTYIGSGLDLGTDSNRAVRLLAAPNGDLYGFNIEASNGSRSWGRIDRSSGTFTTIGDLSSDFLTSAGFGFAREDAGYAIGFDSTGNLFATGFIGSSTYAYGTYDLTTGAFNQTATSNTPFATSLVAVPEPSSLVMLASLLTICGVGTTVSRLRSSADTSAE